MFMSRCISCITNGGCNSSVILVFRGVFLSRFGNFNHPEIGDQEKIGIVVF